MTWRLMSLSIGVMAVLTLALFTTEPFAQEKPRYAGPTEQGFLLPNGWTFTPAGEQVPLADLPLNIIPLADDRHVLVATSGYNAHELSLVDLEEKKVVDQPGGPPELVRPGAGSRGRPDLVVGRRRRRAPRVSTGRPSPDPDRRPRAGKARKDEREGPQPFPERPGARSRIARCSTRSTSTPAPSPRPRSGNAEGDRDPRPAGARPYDVAVARNGTQLYVSDWAGRAVRVLDPADLRTVARIAVGEHPNQIAVHPKDDRIFVACASSNCVSVIDTRRGIVTETIHTALFPKAPEGSTPDALAVAPDGKTLYVANADNNCVAVIDIAAPGRSQVKGFIPTGWYPTAVAVTPDGKTLLVGVGKGNQTKAQPDRAGQGQGEDRPDQPPGRAAVPFPYIGTTLSGALSIVPVPDDKALAAYTETVYRNCPYSDKLLTDAPHPEKTAIPTKVGDPSPIKHVIYIIKENRTYDQVFGDMTRGNGDPSLVMFGAR